jgi:hypothetical protein
MYILNTIYFYSFSPQSLWLTACLVCGAEAGDLLKQLESYPDPSSQFQSTLLRQVYPS